MSSDSEAAVIESIVRSRLSVIQDSSSTVVSACAAWVGVYSSIAPAVITRVWASLLTDAAATDTDQRVGLLAVMHESLQNCARRGGSDDVIRKFILAVQRDVPAAITAALEIEKPQNSSNSNNNNNSNSNNSEANEFRKSSLQALTLWRNFTGFFPSKWLEKTIASLSPNTNSMNNAASGEDSALVVAANTSSSANQHQQVASAATNGSLAAAAGIDSLAAESSGLAEILRLFQKYNASLERLRRYEADASTSASALENVRDEVIHRARPLLAKLGSSGGVAGFIPNIEGEVRRLSSVQQQQQQTAVPEDAADPLEDFF